MSEPSCPVAAGQAGAGAHPMLAPGPGACPMRNSEPEVSQAPHPDQRMPLSTDRVVASIPKTETFTPQHQPTGSTNWTYPSEQMFYNALRRKGYHGAREEDIPAVVAIHNAVNEMAWSKVMAWESAHEQ